MSKRSITDEEIALIKAMLARGMKNKDIQFHFNRQDRAVNSGRITDIGNGRYSTSGAIAAADDATLDSFLATFGPVGVASVTTGGNDSGPMSPVSAELVAAMFHQGADQVWRLIEGESDTTECKASFGLKHSYQWIKPIAALANNRGGYVFFGVADGGHKGTAAQDLSYAVIGLKSDEFTKVDPAEITSKLRSVLDPTPRIEIATRLIGGTIIGVIHVEQHPSRPIIAQKADGGGEIREGDIFYRYPGQSNRIKYSDLRAMLDQRDRQARLDVMPMVERLLALGPRRALLADLEKGTIGDGSDSILIDPQLIDQINFIREGAFDEVDGAPTLKLVGEVVSAGRHAIQSRGVVTDDILLRNFLTDELIAAPQEYIRYAAIGGRAAWIPVGYFAKKAGLTRTNVQALVAGCPESARKTALLKRIESDNAAQQVLQGAPKALLDAIVSGPLPSPSDTKSAQNIAQAICGMASRSDVGLTELRSLLGQCLRVIDTSSNNAAMSHIRRAACRIDELFFPLLD